MDQLFIEIEILTKNYETEIFTTLPSFLALYVYRFLDSPKNIKLCFVSTNLPTTAGRIKLRSDKLRHELTDVEIVCKNASNIEAIKDLRLPVYAKNENIYISGMCAVCRELVQRQKCPARRKLLGFKDNCLLAPAENSIWTCFCEVNIIEALNQLLYKQGIGNEIEIVPEEISRFEQHMNEPVRMHNIYKVAREQANQSIHDIKAGGDANIKYKSRNGKILIDCKIPKEELLIEHRFAEGVAFTIADLILYPCMRLIFQCCYGMLIHFPLTSTWLSEIDSFDVSCYLILKELNADFISLDDIIENGNTNKELKIAVSEATSLYKSDPKRYKPRNRIYTEQSEVEAALNKLQALDMEFSSESHIVYDQKIIDWETIEPAHEKTSALPQERLIRKRQQLENVANAVVSLAEPGDRIIDFCSGTGHLGILLALRLPECQIILMENKAISLERARKRTIELNLKNCKFYQCNIDYLVGKFDLGTSLHACGTATDIVLQQCLRSRAKFVYCPCCYGSLQPMPHINYPQSKRFYGVLEEKDFLYIAHTADQAHELGTLNCKPEITRQGQLCMDIVDTDRKLKAEEAGYDVILTRLKPEKCTPKNRLLVGRIVDNTIKQCIR